MRYTVYDVATCKHAYIVIWCYMRERLNVQMYMYIHNLCIPHIRGSLGGSSTSMIRRVCCYHHGPRLGWTALHLAASYGHLDVTQFLAEHWPQLVLTKYLGPRGAPVMLVDTWRAATRTLPQSESIYRCHWAFLGRSGERKMWNHGVTT